jgi:hypothetical protein
VFELDFFCFSPRKSDGSEFPPATLLPTSNPFALVDNSSKTTRSRYFDTSGATEDKVFIADDLSTLLTV